MRTIEYPYFQPPFPTYNIAQQAVIPHLDKDVNIVVAFATAVGKTVLAECMFGYHLSQDESCRVAYVSPYRSLGAEKYESWMANEQLARYGILLNTGDHLAEPEEYETARIAVITSESFDSKTRGDKYRRWLLDMACVVFDEAHIVGTTRRGAAVESAMMRFSRINGDARLMMLSATMGNARDVAKWVKSLNGKPTKCITSEWRPTKVDVKYLVVDGDKIDFVVNHLKQGVHGKTLIFVHSKVVGSKIVKGLRSVGIRSAFHNASLRRHRREEIEKAFNDSFSGLNVLVSTSTLGAGVNVGEDVQ